MQLLVSQGKHETLMTMVMHGRTTRTNKRFYGFVMYIRSYVPATFSETTRTIGTVETR